MRILHILDHSIPLQSGYTFRTRAILRQQREVGWHTCHVTGPKQGAVQQPVEDVDGLTFYRTNPLRQLAQIPWFNQAAICMALSRRLGEVIEEVRPDVLHAHSPALNGLAAWWAARRYGLPLVYEVRAFWEDAAVDHGTSREGSARYRLTRALESFVLRRAQAVTTICEGLKKEIRKRGIAEDKITVIPNAVDLDSFPISTQKNPQLISQWNLQNSKVLGFVGSFYAYEGLDLLIRALPAIVNVEPDCKLLLVGGGPQEANLKQLVVELGLEGQVIFTGRVPHNQVQDYYSLIDILVYPRKAMRLTDLVTPLKPLEAMAQNKLVVASDVGGHKELIENGVNGILFQAGSVEALTKAVIGLLSHREQWPRFYEAGRRFVEEQRNWGVSVGRYEEVYQAALQAGKEPVQRLSGTR